ncbi:MAG: hypothetical protein LBT90_03265, partial [Holosporaceae bacterium]|nr:hypothetical protein [Holosporaceae bacterium]
MKKNISSWGWDFSRYTRQICLSVQDKIFNKVRMRLLPDEVFLARTRKNVVQDRHVLLVHEDLSNGFDEVDGEKKSSGNGLGITFRFAKIMAVLCCIIGVNHVAVGVNSSPILSPLIEGVFEAMNIEQLKGPVKAMREAVNGNSQAKIKATLNAAEAISNYLIVTVPKYIKQTASVKYYYDQHRTLFVLLRTLLDDIYFVQDFTMNRTHYRKAALEIDKKIVNILDQYIPLDRGMRVDSIYHPHPSNNIRSIDDFMAPSTIEEYNGKEKKSTAFYLWHKTAIEDMCKNNFASPKCLVGIFNQDFYYYGGSLNNSKAENIYENNRKKFYNEVFSTEDRELIEKCHPWENREEIEVDDIASPSSFPRSSSSSFPSSFPSSSSSSSSFPSSFPSSSSSSSSFPCSFPSS